MVAADFPALPDLLQVCAAVVGTLGAVAGLLSGRGGSGREIADDVVRGAGAGAVIGTAGALVVWLGAKLAGA
jgi:hypothetical protein